MNADKKPRIGIIPGDPNGIGPELIAKLLSDSQTIGKADVLLIGDEHIFCLGEKQAGVKVKKINCDPWSDDWALNQGISHFSIKTIEPEEVQVAKVSKFSGKSVLKQLDCALDLASARVIDAITFGPFNKAALIDAGLGHEDELHYIAKVLGIQNYISELNTLDGLWTSRVSSHIALKEVPSYITQDRIFQAVYLIDKTLKRSGLIRPRLAVAALNPHGGDNGNFGREEINVIKPAVTKLQAEQINIDGPWPSDTVFLKAKAGEVDGIVTMYHDQGQIALKLMGFDRGVTVQGGIPFPITTPAHGTAFDIAGKKKAEVGATTAAFNLAFKMSKHWDL